MTKCRTSGVDLVAWGDIRVPRAHLVRRAYGRAQQGVRVMRQMKNGHHWGRYVVLRAVLAVSSLVSFLHAAGAGRYFGQHWG